MSRRDLLALAVVVANPTKTVVLYEGAPFGFTQERTPMRTSDEDEYDVDMDFLDRAAQDKDPTHVKQGEKLCPDCFTYHVGTCA